MSNTWKLVIGYWILKPNLYPLTLPLTPLFFQMSDVCPLEHISEKSLNKTTEGANDVIRFSLEDDNTGYIMLTMAFGTTDLNRIVACLDWRGDSKMPENELEYVGGIVTGAGLDYSEVIQGVGLMGSLTYADEKNGIFEQDGFVITYYSVNEEVVIYCVEAK